jgi:small conductance mechanosensitive channel
MTDFDIVNIMINLGQIIIVLVLFGVLHWFLGKTLDEIGKVRGLDIKVINQIKLFEKYIVFTIVLIIILGILGVDLTVIATSVGVVGIAVGLTTRDIISNFFKRDFHLD